MDTSETYIKMSDCEEIQGGWNIQCRGQNDYWWAEVESSLNGRGICMVISERGAKTKYIWLPRQDQLQKMVKGNLTDFILALNFGNWIEEWHAIRVDYMLKPLDVSMEHLWLAFVMKEKYNKVWLNGEWVNNGYNRNLYQDV